MPHNQPVIAVEARDGHRFELIHVPSDAARASLLFLPGMGLSARQYIHFAKVLAEQDIEIFIHEWRGIGSSSCRASRHSDWSYRELLDEDLTAASDAICKQTGKDAIVIGGHSLGSQFACLKAAMAPDLYNALILVAGGSPYWRTFGLRMKLLMAMVIAGFPMIAGAMGYYPGKKLGFGGREARGVISDWARTARTGRYRLSGMNTDLEAALADLQMPVLAINMADDWFVPESSLKWLTGKLEQCDVSHHTLVAESNGSTADHYAWMHTPEATVACVAKWMKKTETH